MTQFPSVLRRTEALEADGLVQAGSSVQTLLRLTGHGSIANLTAPAIQTLAGVPSIGIEASAAIQAWILVALIHIRLAEGTRVAGAAAVAAKSINPINAAPIILARLRGTLIRVHLAPGTRISLGTLAGQGSTSSKDHAGSIVQAGIGLAEWVNIHLRLAVLTTVVGIAEALVISARVLQAGATVLTRILGTR